jgi:RNA polymerase sigma-70 factor (ECF subfamily)
VAAATSTHSARELLAQREMFKRFIHARVGNDADAEDILQNSLIKALAHAGELRDDTKLTAWFYQVLRRAIIDHARSRQAVAAREQRWADDPALAADPETERALCRCFEPLIASLKPRHAALLRAVEFENRPVAEAAAALGLSANHASVALHRARAELRSRLEAFCGDCANGACLDCDCPPTASTG